MKLIQLLLVPSQQSPTLQLLTGAALPAAQAHISHLKLIIYMSNL